MSGNITADPILLFPIPLTQLFEEFKNIIREEIAKKEKLSLEEKFLSPAETCCLFQPKISRQTLHNWTRQGKIQEHRLGGKVLYKYSELITAMTVLKRYKK